MKRKCLRLFIDITSIGAWVFLFWYSIQTGKISHVVVSAVICTLAIIFTLLVSYGYLDVSINTDTKDLFKLLWEEQIIHSMIGIILILLLVSGIIYCL